MRFFLLLSLTIALIFVEAWQEESETISKNGQGLRIKEENFNRLLEKEKAIHFLAK